MRKVVCVLLFTASTALAAQERADGGTASWEPARTSIVYPRMFAATDVEGVVDIDVVIDTAGRVETTSLRILRSTHELFTQSVRDAVASGLATRAVVNGVTRNEVVRHRFVFAAYSEPVCLGRQPRVSSGVTLVCAPSTDRPQHNDEGTPTPAFPFKPPR